MKIHFIGVAFLCIALGAGGYLISRNDTQLAPPGPKTLSSVPKKRSGADACRCQGCGCKGGPGWRDASGYCVGRRSMTERCGSPPSTRCTYEGARQVCSNELEIVIYVYPYYCTRDGA